MPEQPVGAIRTLLVGTYRDAKFSLDGTKMYATAGNTVSVVDVAAGSVVAQYDMGRAVGAFDLSADGRYLAVTANPTGTSAPQNSASFQRIDLTTGTIETFTFVTSKVDLTSLIVSDFMDIVQLPGNRIMATTQQLGGGIIIIDLNGASPTITKIAASSASGYLDASADHTRVVVSGGGVHHYLDGVGITGSDINDPYAGAAVPPDPIPFREAALSPLADLIMVAGRPYNTSLTLQPAIEAQLRFGSKVTAFNADGTRLYGVVDNLLAVYDTASWQVIAVYPLDAVAAANRGGSALGGYTYSGFGDTIEVSSDGRYVSLISTAGVILLDLNLVVSIATPQSDNQLGLRTQIGLDGDDQLGGVDALQLYGGLGDDTYTVFQNFSRITEYASEGTDTVLVGVSNYALTENVEIGTVTLTGGAWVGGNELDNVLNGNIGGDWLAGAAGADTILGNGGIDRIDGGEDNDTLDGGEGSDTVSGDAGADAIAGGEGDDLLASATLSSSIYTTSDDLGSEIDIISGGAGNDGVWIGYGDSADGGADTDTLYLSLFAAPSGLALTTASLLGSAPLTLGGGTIVNFEVLGGLRGTEQGDTITVSGMAGPATINSGGGDDVVYATDTAVNLDGGSGNDHFYSGSAADNFAGNIGTNTLDYSLFGAGVTVTYQFDRSGIGPGGDTFSNVQIVSGSNFNDLLTGGQQADQLEGQAGDDVLIGGMGADTLLGGESNDTLYSQDQTPAFFAPSVGNPGVLPLLDARSDRDILNGGGGNDIIFAGIRDTIDGGEGVDTLYVNFRNNVATFGGLLADFTLPTISYIGFMISGIEHVGWIHGTSFSDIIRLDNAAGVLAVAYGDSGHDQMFAGIYTGSLSGEGDNDTLDGSGSQHLLFLDGGSGDDRLIIGSDNGGAGMVGGTGTDTLVAASSVTSLGAIDGIEAIELQSGSNLTLTGAQFIGGFAANSELSGTGTFTVNLTSGTAFNASGMTLAGGTSITFTINGSTAADLIKTNVNTVNTVNAGAGNDQIRGGLLADTINGGDNNDKIIGYGGADVLTGGAGNDQFRYLFAGDSGIGVAADRITDFLSGTDRLNFALLDADPVAAGRQALSFIDTAAFTATGAAQVRYAASGADLLVQVDFDGNGTADMEIVLEGAGAQTLTSGDFML